MFCGRFLSLFAFYSCWVEISRIFKVYLKINEPNNRSNNDIWKRSSSTTAGFETSMFKCQPSATHLPCLNKVKCGILVKVNSHNSEVNLSLKHVKEPNQSENSTPESWNVTQPLVVSCHLLLWLRDLSNIRGKVLSSVSLMAYSTIKLRPWRVMFKTSPKTANPDVPSDAAELGAPTSSSCWKLFK